MSSNLDVGPFIGNLAAFQDVRATGVAGQAISATTPTKLEFNTVRSANSFVSLSGNEFPMIGGKYKGLLNITRFPIGTYSFEVTDGTTVYDTFLIVVMEANPAPVPFAFELPSDKTIYIEVETTDVEFENLGAGLSLGNSEAYQKIEWWKVG